jgi:hypothetical protein
MCYISYIRNKFLKGEALMKRYILLVFLGILVISGVAAQTLRGSTMYVSVKSVPLKASTDFWATEQGTLVYGNQVTVLQEKGKWVEVRSAQPALTGWMSATGLTSKRIISGSSTSASVSELALAGKGFSEEIEQEYKKADELDYTLIDAMEAQQVSNQELRDFLTQGHLQLAKER